MKKYFFILALSLIASPSFAEEEDDLFDIDAGENEIKDASPIMKDLKSNLFIDPTAPTTGSPADYVNWMAKRFDAAKRHHMADLVDNVKYKSGARCLWHPEAFKFTHKLTDPIFGEVYEVSCLAGPSDKLITHVLNFRVQVKNVGTCLKPEDIQKHFSLEANRNAKMATAYAYGTARSACSLFITHSEPFKAIRGATAMTADRINKALTNKNYRGLHGILEQSKKRKDDGDSPGNPAAKYGEMDSAKSAE